MPEATVSPNVRLVNFFGQLPGQSKTDLLKEIRAVPDADRAELVALLDKQAA